MVNPEKKCICIYADSRSGCGYSTLMECRKTNCSVTELGCGA